MKKIVFSEHSNYQHAFGGEPRHDIKHKFQLCFTFDLKDPDFILPFSGINYLSLYYPFRYSGFELSYSLLNDADMKIWNETDLPDPAPDFPFENYPDQFPKRPFVLQNLTPEELKKHQRGRSIGIPIWKDTIETLEPDYKPPCKNPNCAAYKSTDAMKPILLVEEQEIPLDIVPNRIWGDHEVQTIWEYCSKCGSINAYNLCG